MSQMYGKILAIQSKFGKVWGSIFRHISSNVNDVRDIQVADVSNSSNDTSALNDSLDQTDRSRNTEGS